MKNKHVVNNLLLLIAVLAMAPACKKTITEHIKEPNACFTTTMHGVYDNVPVNSTFNYLDSSFSFYPCVIPNNTYTYQWDFGDGYSSTETNPRHKYMFRGNYTVTLIASNNDQAFDTTQQTLRVILGQQLLALNNTTSFAPIAIEPTGSNDYVLLGYSGTSGLYSLVQLGALYKQKSVVTLPSTYQFASMKPVNDGNYIFTGSATTLTKTNELVKLRPDGSLIWNKTLGPSDNNTYAVQTSDDGFAVVGTRLFPTVPVANNYTVVSKTDNSGNLQWQRTFEQEGMMRSQNLTVDADGIVIAGYKPSTNNACTYCDTLLITKLDNAGNIVWKNAIRWGLSTNQLYTIKTARLSNGSYAVFSTSQKAIYIFSNTGAFIDRKLAPANPVELLNAPDGNVIALQAQTSGANQLRISKLSIDGFEKWYLNNDLPERTPTGAACCTTTYPVAVTPLKTGGYVIVGDRTPVSQTPIRHMALFMEVDENGKLK